MSPKRLRLPTSPQEIRHSAQDSPPMKQQTQQFHFSLKTFEFLFYLEEVEDTDMDWINCNTCCRQPGDERERTFALTSCGHIFCDLCLAKAESKNKCMVCSSSCQLIQLSSKMKPDAEMFFLEPATLLKKQFTQINRLLEFQKDHRIRLVSFHRKVLQKYKTLEKQQTSANSQLQELEHKYSSAKTRIQELERENQKLRSVISSMEHTKSISPKVSPEGTIISPGRLTLVKKSQSSSMAHRGPPSAPTTTTSSPHMAPYGSLQGGGTLVRQFSPVPYQHQPPQHYQTRNTDVPSNNLPGGGYYRNITPVTSRTMSGPMNHMSMAMPSHLHSPSPGLQSFMKPPHPIHQPRPFTPNNISSVMSSPDSFVRQPHDIPMYKKYM